MSHESYDTTLQTYICQNPPSERTEGFCERCSTIDFAAIHAIDISHNFVDIKTRVSSQDAFWPTRNVNGRFPTFVQDRDSLVWTIVPVFDLGEKLIDVHRSCSLCTLLDAVSKRMRQCQPATGWYLGISTQVQKRLYLVGTSPTWQGDTAERGYLLMYPETSKYSGDLGWIRRSTNAGVDYEAFVQEIKNCVDEDPEFSFEDLASLHDTDIRGLKLIDCYGRQVVDAPSKAEYVALSYVWDSHDRSKDEFVEADGTVIEKKLCQTIKDAMFVTIKLGMKYLWVDRYCIYQTNEALKDQQTKEMHKIYRHAWVTIGALKTSSASIPGVSSTRDKLLLSTSKGFVIRYIGPDMITHHSLSEWSSRAWTYQECFLSPRLLSFTNDQAFLVCQHGSFSEIHQKSPHGQHKTWEPKWQPRFDMETRMNKAKLLETEFGMVLDFQSALKNYCSRHLTYEKDSLAAFTGYISCLNMPFCKGVPIYKVSDRSLDERGYPTKIEAILTGGCVGLSWVEQADKPRSKFPTVEVAPRPDATTNEQVCVMFPSWSWASCRPGYKVFSCHCLRDDLVNASGIVATATAISIKTMDGRLLPWTNSVDQAGNRLTNSLHLTTRLVQFVIPAQHVDEDLYNFTLTFLVGINGLSHFAGIDFAWPVLTNATMLGLGTASVVFHPDKRALCDCHGQLHVSQDPRKLKSDMHGVAALLFVERSTIREQYAVAHWLALRYDVKAQAMRRIGLICVEFGAGDGSAIWNNTQRKDSADQVSQPVWELLADAIRTDMKATGNVDEIVII